MGHLGVAHDDLDDPGRVAQVEEGDAAVVAAAGHPAGERHGLPDVVRPEASGGVRADHGVVSSLWVLVRRTAGTRSSCGGAHEPGSAGTCSPLRMSLTAWPPSASGNHT